MTRNPDKHGIVRCLHRNLCPHFGQKSIRDHHIWETDILPHESQNVVQRILRYMISAIAGRNRTKPIYCFHRPMIRAMNAPNSTPASIQIRRCQSLFSWAFGRELIHIQLQIPKISHRTMNGGKYASGFIFSVSPNGQNHGRRSRTVNFVVRTLIHVEFSVYTGDSTIP